MALSVSPGRGRSHNSTFFTEFVLTHSLSHTQSNTSFKLSHTPRGPVFWVEGVMVKTLMFRYVSAKSHVSQVMVSVLQVSPPDLSRGVCGVSAGRVMRWVSDVAVTFGHNGGGGVGGGPSPLLSGPSISKVVSRKSEAHGLLLPPERTWSSSQTSALQSTSWSVEQRDSWRRCPDSHVGCQRSGRG